MLNSHSSYIVASSKSWHYSKFKEIKKNRESHWFWVEKPNDLNVLLEKINPKYIFFLHWNWLVPDDIYQKYECVCFHMTDVPYGRGGSPLQNLILTGHSETKITALRMVKEVDAGPVYIKRDLELTGKARDIYKKAGLLSYEIIQWIINSQPIPTPQEGDVTVFKRRTPDQSKIPNKTSPQQLYDFIRMLDAEGYPHAFINHGNLKLELTDARLESGSITAQVKIVFKADSE